MADTVNLLLTLYKVNENNSVGSKLSVLSVDKMGNRTFPVVLDASF